MELKNLIFFLLRRFAIIAVSLLAALAGAVLVIAVAPKQYTAVAKLSYATDSNILSSILSSLAIQRQSSALDVEPEFHVERITVAPVYKELVQRLDLTDNGGEPLHWQDIAKAPPFISTLFPKPLVEVKQVEDAELIEIEARADTPEQAALMANTFVRLYIEQQYERHSQQCSNALEFLETEMKSFQQDYDKALQALKELKQEKGFYSLENISQAELTRFNELLREQDNTLQSMAENAATMVVLRKQLSRLGLDSASPTALSQNPQLRKLKSDLVDAQVELRAMELVYTKEHPQRKALEARIDKLQKDLAKEIEIQKQTAEQLQELEQQQESLQSRLDELEVNIERYRIRLSRFPEQEMELSKLRFALENVEDVYKPLYDTYLRILSAQTLAITDLWTPQPAEPPQESNPSSPSKGKSVALALFFGTCFGLVAAYTLDVLDPRPRYRQTYQSLGWPVLGIVSGPVQSPHSRLTRWLTAAGIRRSRAAQAEEIGHAAAFLLREQRNRAVVVAGAASRMDASQLASLLAVFEAGSSRRVLLVDAFAERPTLHAMFRLSAGPGVRQVLEGATPFKDAVRPTRIQGLDVLPWGGKTGGQELPEALELQAMLQKALGQYDQVVVLAAPFLEGGSKYPASALPGEIILLFDHRQASESLLARVQDFAGRVGAEPLGLVVTHATWLA